MDGVLVTNMPVMGVFRGVVANISMALGIVVGVSACYLVTRVYSLLFE